MEPEQPFYTYSVHEKGTASAEMTALSSFLTTVMTYLMKDDELNEIFPEDASELPRRVRSFLAVDRIVAKVEILSFHSLVYQENSGILIQYTN